MQHTKSPPSLLPELKLLTICTQRERKFTSNTHETHRQPAHRPQGLMFCADLALHVHDDHRVGAVAHHKVFRVLGQQEDVVDGDVGASRGAQRFEGVGALGGLHVPHLVPGHTHTHTRQSWR